MSYPIYMVPAGDVLPVFFGSYAGATGASITLTGLAVTDIEIYKDGSTTQRASDAGYTLLDTDGIDFDGLTGIHGFSIDTGDNTDAGFYTVGAWFHVVVSAVTIDGQTVSFIAAAFRLMPAESVAGKPKVDTDTFGGSAGTFSSGRPEVNTTHAAGTAWGSGAITAASIASDAITAAKIATGAIDADAIADNAIDAGAIAADAITAAKIADGAIDAATFASGAITATAIAADAIGASELAADAVAEIADAVWDEVLSGHTTVGTAGQRIQPIRANTAQAGAAGTITLDASASAADDFYNGDLIQITAGTGVGQARVISDYVGSTKVASVAENWATNPSSDSVFVILPGGGATVTGTVDANVVSVENDAITAAAIADNAIDAGAIASNAITAAKIASDAITAAKVASDVTTEIQSGLATAAALATLSNRIAGLVMAQGTIGSTGNSTTALHLTGLTYGDDELNDYLLVIFDVSTSEYHARWIEDWVLSTALATVATLPFTPQNATDTYWLLPIRQDVSGGSGLDAAGVRAAVGLASANLDTQLSGIQSDTNDIQTRIPAALVSGRIDASVGAVAANAITATAINADAITAAKVASDVGTEIAAAVLAAAAANPIDANVQEVNDVALVGDGDGTPWGPA